MAIPASGPLHSIGTARGRVSRDEHVRHLPAYGFFIRHAAGIELDNVEVGFMTEDRRPAFVIESARDVELHNVDAQNAADVPTFVLMNVEDFQAYHTRPFGDVHLEHVDRREF